MKHNNLNHNPEEQLATYLAKQGMKLTNQRRLIVSEFFKADEHLTAEELYWRLRDIDSSLGQATVYRTLKLMCKAGLARELHFGNAIARFEPRDDSAHHDHLICDECGKTLAVFDEEIEKIQSKLAAELGFKMTSHRMYLYGICPQCQTKAN